MSFSVTVLRIDPEAEARRIEAWIRERTRGQLRRRGVVVGLSGGVDSSVVAALAARALGEGRVLGLIMPERDSSPDSAALAARLAAHIGVETITEELAPALEALGCYARQIAAIRRVVPEYGPGWRCKLGLPSLLDGDRLNVSRLTMESPSGERRSVRMPVGPYLSLVAATSYKQRLRKTTEYYHADRLAFAVAGTANRQEHELGFFVKQGDGAADLEPIAHLYKTQVYALAEHLGVPEEIRERSPTTETFSLPQTQEEFYFAMPYELLDLCLAAHDAGVPAEEASLAIGLSAAQISRAYSDIEAKRRAARYLHAPPLTITQGEGA
ncbi:MAG: NAD(+) synthase [Sandaracinaceae bacterium]|nr:NAD(+) synthase [Sandaracinaceae bacterium]